MNIISEIQSVYDRGEMSYLLFTYVDRNFWTSKLKEYFPNRYIDNLTDFNYNKCFSMYINFSDADANIGSKKFDEYIIKNKTIYGAIIEISALAPYCIVKYSRYYIEEEEIKCDCKDMPYCQEHMGIHEQIMKFISKYKLTLLDDDILMTEVPGKSLELREAPVSAYNCLFQDTYAYY